MRSKLENSGHSGSNNDREQKSLIIAVQSGLEEQSTQILNKRRAALGWGWLGEGVLKEEEKACD